MKKLSILAVLVLLFLILGCFYFVNKDITGQVVRGKEVVLYEFYGAGCPHCARLTLFLDDVKEKYPDLVIKQYETYFNKEGRKFFEEIAESFGHKIEGVPTVFIDDKVIVGFNDAIGNSIEQEVLHCLEYGCIDPAKKVGEAVEIIGDSSPLESPEKEKFIKGLTLPVVLGAAAVDAINPCAFAVLIILLATLLAAGAKKKVLFAGLAFSLAIYISYFLMGLGLFSAIQAAGLTYTFYWIVAILAILIGLFNLKDYLWYGKWFVMEVPLSWRPKMKMLIKEVTSIPGAFLIGFVVSLFLLPCTSGPYIVILGLLAKAATRNYALILLLIYNLIFILPMLIITLGIYFGFTTTEKADEWRKRKLKILHLITGIIILLLGIGMILSILIGWI